MKFIKLTSRDNKSVYVNMNKIVEMIRKDYCDRTILYTGDVCYCSEPVLMLEYFEIHVLETPEEIMQMIM